MSGPLLWGYRNVSFSSIFVFSLKDKIAVMISGNGSMGVELLESSICFVFCIGQRIVNHFFISEYYEKFPNRVSDHIIHKASLVKTKKLYILISFVFTLEEMP